MNSLDSRLHRIAKTFLTLGEESRVLVQEQHEVSNLSSNWRHVVVVEVVLDGLVDSKVLVNQNSGGKEEDNRNSSDGLSDNLENNDKGGGSRVDASSDQDHTNKDTNQGIGDSLDGVGDDSKLEHSHVLSDLVDSLLRLHPFDKNPSDGDGGVDHAHNGDSLEDTSSQSGTSKATSTLFHESNLFLVDCLFVSHLDELLIRGSSFSSHCQDVFV